MFCPQCGSQLPEGAKFCNSCGASLNQQAPAPAPAASTHYRQPASQHQAWGQPQQQHQAPNIAQASAIVAAPAAQQPQAMQWTPATTPELGDAPHPIKNTRSLAAYIILSFLTFGIYSYYFIYKVAKDMNTMCSDDDQKVGGLVFFIVVSFLTLGIYAIYWWYKITNRAYLNAPRYGAVITQKGSTFLMWYVLGFLTFGIGFLVAFHIAIKNVNILATAYNQTHGYAFVG